ncbi:MAG: hypothetical protein AAFZ05_01885, partial [Pseudomonadota bacterium]
FVDAPLTANAAVALTSDQAHYLRNVLRAGAGDRLLHWRSGGHQQTDVAREDRGSPWRHISFAATSGDGLRRSATWSN